MMNYSQEDAPALDVAHILYGGDYNPEQWPESIWDEDMRFMGEANWNIATLPVFGWVSLEPEEGVFTFEWLDRILDKLHAGGVRVCLATATASVPAWLDQKYPDVLVTNDQGVKARHGNRHTFCPNSENFRRLSTALARKLAERYKDHPAVALWHISNEYGTHCFCEANCAPAFRRWLQEKYGSLEELNRVWYTRFWGHTFTDWSQIEPAYANGERSMNALRLDYMRFQSDSLLNCFRAEKAVLREITPEIPVTTNLMGTFFPLNYREWAKEMDIVSWDNYPGPNAPPRARGVQSCRDAGTERRATVPADGAVALATELATVQRCQTPENSFGCNRSRPSRRGRTRSCTSSGGADAGGDRKATRRGDGASRPHRRPRIPRCRRTGRGPETTRRRDARRAHSGTGRGAV
jgi:hypothetical protein